MSIDVDGCYRRYGPMVLRRCRHLLKDEELALDAMHDVFVRLIASHDRLDDSGLSALLFKVATNVCLNRIRTRRRKPEDHDDELLSRIAGDEDPTARSTARAMLDRIFGNERESTQVIAVLHLLDGMTLDEVATNVGLSVSGVRKRLRTLRARVSELEGV